jgi:hypothetical protein
VSTDRHWMSLVSRSRISDVASIDGMQHKVGKLDPFLEQPFNAPTRG